MEVFIGNICAFPYSFTPLDWLTCNGDIVAMGQYQALGAVLGNLYGGNGSTSFGLPNLQGRVALGADQRTLENGDVGGSVQFAATEANLPPHYHTVVFNLGANVTGSNSLSPVGNYPALAPGAGSGHGQKMYATTSTGVNALAPQVTVSVQPTGAGTGQMINTISPYQVSLYCIATMGIFPMRG